MLPAWRPSSSTHPPRRFVSVTALAGLLVISACTRGEAESSTTSSEPTTTTTVAATSSTVPPSEVGDPLASLERMRIPAFDIADWFERAGLVDGEPALPRPLAEVGDVETFVFDDGSGAYDIDARLEYANDMFTMWVEVGSSVDLSQLAVAADILQDDVMPKLTPIFGPIPDFGVDADPRVAVLHLESLGGALGLFGAYDLLPPAMFPESNGQEMLYFGLDAADVGSDTHIATLAHELQHLLDSGHRLNTPLWLAEGMAQLAEEISGYNAVTADITYLAHDKVQLDDWGYHQFDERHYGAAYLFTLYLWERVGEDFMRELTTSPYDGLGAVADTLQRRGMALREVFGDWMVANYLDDPSIDGGRFGYSLDDTRAACPVERITSLPSMFETAIPQFAPDYITVTGNGRVDLTFEGTTEVSILGTEPHEGDWFWWSGRGTNSAASLTHEFDLSAVDSAMLEFRAWFDMAGGDLVVVSASTDGGRSWTPLHGRHAGLIDMGSGLTVPGYEGTSGGYDQPNWMRDEVDLARFVGERVLVRFEYLTDLVENRTGIGIDSIAIPEIDFEDGAETAMNGWVADGFVRAPAVVDQLWEVRVIQPGTPQPVRTIPVVRGTGTYQLALSPDAPTAAVAVAGTAPATVVPGSYRLTVDGAADLAPPPLVDGIDRFTDECTGWELEHADHYALRYDTERLAIDMFERDVFTWSARGGYVEDASVGVTATFGENVDTEVAAGVLCRLSDEGFYDIEVASDGQVFLGVYDRGDYEVLHDWEFSEAVLTGAGATNQIDVGCVGESITLDVNGVRVIGVVDDRLDGGEIALVGATFNTSTGTVYYDDFTISTVNPDGAPGFVLAEDASTGWDTWQIHRDDRSDVWLGDEGLVLSVEAADWDIATNAGVDATDVIVDADIRVTKAPVDASFSLSCRVGAGDSYVFFVGLDGFYNISAVINDTFHTLVGWSSTDAIDPTPGVANHIRIECLGETLRLAANGVEIASVTDDRLAGGDVSIGAWTFDEPGMEIVVDSVLIRRNP